MPKNRAPYYWDRGGYYFRKWVPTRYRTVDPRQSVVICLHTKDELEAAKKAVAVEKEVQANWDALLAGQSSGATSAWKAALSLAAAKGFSYVPAADLAKGPLLDIIVRLEALPAFHNSVPQTDAPKVQAVLGSHPIPKQSILDVKREYFEQAGDKILNKTSGQIKRWTVVRERAVNDLISVIGDKSYEDIDRSDMKKYRAWWLTRISDGAINPETANKYISYLSGMFQSWAKINGRDVPNPFMGIKFKRPPPTPAAVFSATWITRNFVNGSAQDGLNPEARFAFLIMINTGARPSAILGTKPEDIFLGPGIPFIRIEPNDWGGLKNPQSRREIPLVGVSHVAAAQYKELGCAQTYRNKGDRWSATVNKYLQTNGLKETSSHTTYALRHSFETRLRETGCDEQLRCELMGHGYNRPRYGTISHRLLQSVLEKIAL
mgnify:CR=1 FL=1